MTPVQFALPLILIFSAVVSAAAAPPDTISSRKAERESLANDFLSPKLDFKKPPVTYGDVKTALESIEGYRPLLSQVTDQTKLNQNLPADFPIDAASAQILVRWYHNLTGSDSLQLDDSILVQLSGMTTKALADPTTRLLQVDLDLMNPPGLRTLLLKYEIADFTLKTDGVSRLPLNPQARYELVLAGSSPRTPLVLEYLLPADIIDQQPTISLQGKVQLSLLSQNRKIQSDITPPQSLRQLQRYLRTGRRLKAASYGDFEIRWKNIDRQPDGSALITFELDYPDRPFLFESHMTPTMTGKTEITFQEPPSQAVTIACERTSINGELETLDLVEQTGPVDWDAPMISLSIEVAPLIKRIPIDINVQAKLVP